MTWNTTRWPIRYQRRSCAAVRPFYGRSYGSRCRCFDPRHLAGYATDGACARRHERSGV